MKEFFDYVALIVALLSLITFPVALLFIIWTGAMVYIQILATAVVAFVVSLAVHDIIERLEEED